MPALIKDLYYKAEETKGKKLLVVGVIIFAIFIPVGIIIGNNISMTLNNSETQQQETGAVTTVEVTSLSGRVVFIDPQLYPNDRISYALVDSSGKKIVLLRAKDEKLAVAEGLNVAVFGKMEKTADGAEDVLIVEKVVVKN